MKKANLGEDRKMVFKTCKNCRFFDEDILTTEKAQFTVYKCDWHCFRGQAYLEMYQKKMDEYGEKTFCDEERWKNKDLGFVERHQILIDSVIASISGLVVGTVLSKI